MIRGQVAVLGLLVAMVFAGCHCDDNTVLEVRKDGTGKGTVTSKLQTMPGPVGELDCGEKCTLKTYLKNTYVLTATPAPGSRFVRWDYDQCPPELVRDSLDCEVYTGFPGPTVVTATFNENRITVSKAGLGNGRVVSTPTGIDCGTSCSATFDTKTSVTLTATAEAGSTFTGWSGACTGASTTCTLVASDAQNVTATFVKAPSTLNVTKAGSGSGTVISTPSGIDCGTTCSAMYETRTIVTLWPMAASGSAFAGWSGACSGMGACTVTVQEVVSVTATFTTVSLPLSVRFSGVGSGRVTSLPAGIDCTGDCMSTFTTGTMVTLTAVAGTGSTFSGWGGACMGTGTCTVTLSAATEVIATFSPAPIPLTVVRAGSGSGTVTSMPTGIDCGTTCTASFTAATTVTLVATADTNSVFTGWSGACSGMTTCSVPLMVASTVTATFQLRQVPVSVMLLGTGTGFVTSSPMGIDCGATCSASFPVGTMVTLTPMATVGSTFTGWTGACMGTGACVVSATMATAVGATFTRDTFPLTVAKAGTGGGTVSSNPAGVSCGMSCMTSWDSGSVVTLVAMADSSSSFAGWSGACTGTGSCVVTMSAARNVTATFDRQQFALSIMRSGAGTGTVTSSVGGINCGSSCSASFDSGSMVTLTASAATGSTFTGWSGGGCTGTMPCTVSVSAATSVSANFDRVQYAFSVIRSGTGGGTVTSVPGGISCGNTCSTQLFHGDRITLSAAADQNSTFAGWSGGCTGAGACVVDVTTATTVTATFTRSGATLAVATAGTGSGTVTSLPTGISCGATCASTFDVGSSITLTASPATGSTFAGWSGSGISCPGTGTCTVNLTAAASVTATFTLNRYTVSVAKAGAGTGTVTSSPAGITCGATCSADFDHGSAVVLTAVAGPGSLFSGWSGPGISCPGTGTCTVTPTSALSVIATFARIPRTLTIVRSGMGTGTVTSVPSGITCGTTCAAPFDDGSVVALTATASPGSTFTGWSGGGCSGTGTCAVSMTAATTVTATFDLTQFTLSVVRAGSGGGSVTSAPAGITCGATCSASFLEGASVILTAVQDATSTFAGWSGAGCSGTGTCSVTMSAARSVTATFTRNQYQLQVVKAGTGGGTVTSSPGGIACGASCTVLFDADTPVTLTAAQDATSTFAGWSGAGCSGTGTCSVTMSAARSVTATFNTVTFPLTVSKSGSGSGTVTSVPPSFINCGATCNADVITGTTLSLTATADPGSTFAGWTGACSGTGPCSVLVNAPVSVGAVFVLPNVVFATSMPVSAAMGGLVGADSICAQRALAGGLAGTFKAWLSTSTTNALSRLGTASGWIRPDGLPFANSQADLVAGRILYPLRLDEFGTDIFATKAFTSTLGEGTLNTGVSTCSDWTSTTDQIPAGAGMASLSTTGWTTGAFAPCGSQQRLYCFQVDAPAAVKVTAPAQFRRAFVTGATWTPGGGIGSADALCNVEASAASVPGSYLALLTPLGVSASSRFNVMGAPWIRVDNVSLSPTANSFFIDPFWTATLNVTPARAYGTAFTWSGSTNLLFQGAPSNTCQNWTSSSVNDSANAGVMNDSEVSHAFGGAGTFDCSTAMRLMCLEQ